MKDYYSVNLRIFANLYYNVEKEWASTSAVSLVENCLQDVNYFLQDEPFSKIQRYAKRGAITCNNWKPE